MLLACSACHRQYDVGALAPGTQVRCHCDTVNAVPSPRKRQVRMLHCSDCGGRLASEAATCDWCEAETHPTEHDRRGPCPQCFAPLFEGARFCGECGVKIAPEAVLRAIVDRGCPRCEEPLHLLEDEHSAFHQCVVCDGVWLSKETYESFLERSANTAEKIVVSRRVAARFSSRRRSADPDPHGRCPVCQRFMMRRFFAGSGIALDQCPEHGTWFDKGELEDAGRFVVSGGLLRLKRGRSSRLRRVRHRRGRRRVARRAALESGTAARGSLLAAMLFAAGS